MKAKQILISMALPALFAACANDDFLSAPSTNVGEGNLVELEKGFAVAIAKGEDAATRTAWQLEGWGKTLFYSWLPDLNATNDGVIPENIGFAWRGDTPDANVRTNYKFTLNGYLKNGQTAPKFKKCNDELLITNGYTLGSVSTGKVTLNEYDDVTKTMVASDYTLEQTSGEWGLKNNSVAIEDMYTASKLSENDPYVKAGIFTTENSTVFAGEYIVYFPFNEAFAETGNLPATSPAEFTMDVANTGNIAAHLTGKTFAYGTAKIQKGGSMAESFQTRNLSAIIALNLENKTEAAQNISKVILFDEGNEQGFYTSVGLDATKISAEDPNAGTTGQALYVVDSKTTYSPTLILNLKNDVNEYVTIANDTKQIAVLAALPIDLVQPVAYIMFSDGLCVKKSLEVKSLQGGKVNAFNVTLNKDDLNKKVSIAVDTKSFLQAWANAWDATGVDNVTIETLGNIKFNNEAVVTLANGSTKQSFDLTTMPNGMMFNKNITIKGIGSLTIPADVTWWVKGREDSQNAAKTLTIENPIIIENAGCCGTNPGRLILGNKKDKFGNFLIKSDITNYGKLIAGANNGTGVYTFEGTITNNYDTENEYAAEIYFGGQKGNTINVNKAIQNYGKMELVNRTFNVTPGVDGIEWGTVAPGVNVGVKVFAKGGINNLLGTSTLLVKDQTNLSLNGNSINNGEIEIRSNESTNQSKDGNVKVEQGASLTNYNVIYNKGVFTADRSTLTLNNGAQFVDYVGSQYGGTKATINEGGEYICEVDNATISAGNRLAYALGDNMPTTTVRFVEGPASATYTYDLKNYKDYTKLATVKYVINIPNSIDFMLKNTEKSGSNYVEHVFGTKVTVETARSLKFSEGKFKINGDLIAKAGFVQTMTTGNAAYLTITGNLEMKQNATDFEVQANSTVAATEKTPSDVTIKGNVNLEKNTNFKVAEKAAVSLGANFTIGEGATATFNYSSYTNVQNVIAVNGTFTRILSSGVATANPAKVWCQSYTTGTKAVFTNGYPEMR